MSLLPLLSSSWTTICLKTCSVLQNLKKKTRLTRHEQIKFCRLYHLCSRLFFSFLVCLSCHSLSSFVILYSSNSLLRLSDSEIICERKLESMSIHLFDDITKSNHLIKRPTSCYSDLLDLLMHCYSIIVTANYFESDFTSVIRIQGHLHVSLCRQFCLFPSWQSTSRKNVFELQFGNKAKQIEQKWLQIRGRVH